jgi:hypothetical protein
LLEDALFEAVGWSGIEPTGIAELGRFHQGLIFRQKGLDLR